MFCKCAFTLYGFLQIFMRRSILATLNTLQEHVTNKINKQNITNKI